MNIQRTFQISGVGKYLPKKVVTSEEIEEEINLPMGWIYKNIGVRKRHRATNETNTEMGHLALTEALQDAGLSVGDLDCLIAGAATFDYIIPNRSSLIKQSFEAAEALNFPCIDLNTVCTSFITALDYATMLLATSDMEHIAIVSSEVSSKGLNPQNSETYGLFGDAAAAIIVSRTDKKSGLINYSSQTFSKEAKATIIKGGGNVNHPRDVAFDPELHTFSMDGKSLLREVSNSLPIYLSTFFEKASTSLSQVDLIIPHQASKLGMKMLMKLNSNKLDNVVNQLEHYGNCIAASIPLALVISIQENKLKKGDSCFLIGTAAGLTIGGLLFIYGN